MATPRPADPAPVSPRRGWLSRHAAALAAVLAEVVALKRPVTAAAVASLLVGVLGSAIGLHIDAAEVSSALVAVGVVAGVIEKALKA